MTKQALEARMARIEAIAREAILSGGDPAAAVSEILMLCERWSAER